MTGDSRNELLDREKGISRHGIEPKILIEPFMCDSGNKNPEEIQCYCFNGKVIFEVRIEAGTNNFVTIYDEDLNITGDILSKGGRHTNHPVDNLIIEALDLSAKLSKDFIFVRVDWMIYQNKLFFEELTFTPYSGFNIGIDKKINKKLGMFIKI